MILRHVYNFYYLHEPLHRDCGCFIKKHQISSKVLCLFEKISEDDSITDTHRYIDLQFSRFDVTCILKYISVYHQMGKVALHLNFLCTLSASPCLPAGRVLAPLCGLGEYAGICFSALPSN
jgi:hypothetical protein